MDSHHHHPVPSTTPDDTPNDNTSPANAGIAHEHSSPTLPPSSAMPHTQHGNDHASHAAHGSGHGAHVNHMGHETMFRNRFWVSLLLSIPVLLYSPMLQEWFRFTMPAFPGSTWIAPLFSTIIFLYGGIPFLQMAVPELRNRVPGMMTLISLAILVAYGYSLAALRFDPMGGFFWELVTLIDIMLLGHWLEMRSVRQASGALDELAKLLPDTAERITTDGNTETIALSALRLDDVLLIRPGAKVPADGEIIEGDSHLNEALVTGESQPVSKKKGDTVIAGTINGDGSLQVRVTASGDDTALAGIMRLVAEAQNSRSNAQVLADRAAGWLFYIALATAALTALAWGVAVGWNVTVVERVATVLIIACPHALGLAIPLVVAISTSLGARHGILIRDRHALEDARTITTVLFDKTGTLTEGAFGVVGVATVSGWNEEQALRLAAAVEGDSEHTIARGIRAAAAEKGGALPAVHHFEALKGRGVQAQVDTHTVYIGGPRLLEHLNVQPAAPLAEFTQKSGAQGQTVVYLIQDNIPVAAIALADRIRPESKRAVQRLQELGVEVAMLTGDSEAVAKSVAASLGIERYFAQVLPDQKDNAVADLQRQGKRVAMVGDGVNDAPALARADVGIAIGSGTDVAVESAGVILVKNNPLDVVNLIELSRASYRKMQQNLWWAAGYNIVALPLAAGVLAPIGILLSPAVGAVLMSVSTIVVALNAQLLRRTPLTE